MVLMNEFRNKKHDPDQHPGQENNAPDPQNDLFQVETQPVFLRPAFKFIGQAALPEPFQAGKKRYDQAGYLQKAQRRQPREHCREADKKHQETQVEQGLRIFDHLSDNGKLPLLLAMVLNTIKRKAAGPKPPRFLKPGRFGLLYCRPDLQRSK